MVLKARYKSEELWQRETRADKVWELYIYALSGIQVSAGRLKQHLYVAPDVSTAREQQRVFYIFRTVIESIYEQLRALVHALSLDAAVSNAFPIFYIIML